ncbi:MAG: ABC transporter ATP-binding protein [Acetobacterales bacterium]
MIELTHVHRRYGAVEVLRDIDLRIAERRVAVIGANGSGKSTFARLLNGLVLPSEGLVTVDGIDTRRQAAAVRRRVGFVFQNPDHQIVFPVVEEDVAFGPKNQKLPKDEVARRVDAILERTGLARLRDRPTHLLSGGEKQMLALAGVLVMEPARLVLDEPLTLLDLRNRRRVAAFLDALAQPLVMVTHDLDMIAGWDRVLVFDEGRVAMDAVPAEAVPFYRELMSR